MRRGLQADFDASKLLPGEWAVAIDNDTSKQVVWMCFAPGVVKRMGTYEDFVGIYLPKMLELHDESKGYASSAKVSESNAKTYMESAKTSEQLAKRYMESAFAGTPDGYAALVEQVGRIDIAKSTDYTIHNTKHGGFRLTKVVANTIQNGTPSPITPIPMLSTGDCVDMIQGMYWQGAFTTSNDAVCTKYSIPCKGGDVIKSITDKSMYHAINFLGENGYITSSGQTDVKEKEFTAPVGATKFVMYFTRTTLEELGKITITINGKYLGCAKTHGKNVFDVSYFADSNYYSANGNSLIVNKADLRTYTAVKVFHLKPNTKYVLSVQNPCRLYYGKDFDSAVSTPDTTATYLPFTTSATGISHFKFIADSYPYNVGWVQVEEVEEYREPTEYVPFGETVAYFLTENKMIKGSTLFRENGLVKAIHPMHEIVFDGVNTLLTGADVYQSSGVNLAYASAPTGYDFKRNSDIAFSNIGIANLGSTLTEGFAISLSGGVICIAISDDKSGITSADSGSGTTRANKINAWCKNNPVNAMYELATPIIETLDTQSQIALNGLKTFDGMTIVEFVTRVQPLEFEAEVGTSQVGAYTLKSLNNSESNAVRINELAVAMVSL